ncbi:MAG: hypothetical protein QF619_09290, partial [Candidatus Binatia bacterium]|nr:hypothetical protein [Candidatus Binatia bacterium]
MKVPRTDRIASPGDRAGNLLFYEDPNLGFVINGLIKASHRCSLPVVRRSGLNCRLFNRILSFRKRSKRDFYSFKELVGPDLKQGQLAGAVDARIGKKSLNEIHKNSIGD